MAFLGRLGSPVEPQGGSMAAQGPPRVGVVHARVCDRSGVGGPLEEYRNPARQHLAF